MTRPLGKQQLRLLMLLGRPGTVMVTPADSVARSLGRRGLLSEAGDRITPSGLRALADAMESGQLEQFMEPRR